MLGVKLFSIHTKTRQIKVDGIVKSMQDIINRWKSGKFVPLTDRPISINTFALSKIWYKTGALDIRKGDIEKLNSSIKSWLYLDSFLKPEETVLFRGI